MKATNFDSKEFRRMMNTPDIWNKKFNGIVAYSGAEVNAISKQLNGLEEYGKILDYKKENKEIFLLIEFCGDDGIWEEWVNVYDCKPFNILNYI